MKTNVCLIGHFGGEETFLDGQTIKTRALAQGIMSYGSQQIWLQQVDTYDLRNRKWKFLRQFVQGIFSCRKIVICVSKGGRKVFFPMLYWLSKLTGQQIYHCAIGGRLADEVREKPRWKKYVAAFRYNWVESTQIVEQLQELGVSNARYLPNFKELPRLDPEELGKGHNHPMRFCIFSRICREKGVTDAIQAVRALNQKRGCVVATLDLYGQILPEYQQELSALLACSGEEVCYRGEAAPEDSVTILRQYDALLFPTCYHREGIPGTIIDALCAAVPVIARRWRYCDEMLQDGVTGYCYSFDQPERLLTCLERAVDHPGEMVDMKVHCLERAEPFRAENVLPNLINQLLED